MDSGTIKGMTNNELRQAQKENSAFIDRLSVNLDMYKARRRLLNTEIYDRSAKEMTLEQIAEKLGHKVIVKDV